jgi:hypothetical protein
MSATVLIIGSNSMVGNTFVQHAEEPGSIPAPDAKDLP